MFIIHIYIYIEYITEQKSTFKQIHIITTNVPVFSEIFKS
jgi:hypothetical protein